MQVLSLAGSDNPLRRARRKMSYPRPTPGEGRAGETGRAPRDGTLTSFICSQALPFALGMDSPPDQNGWLSS